MKALNIEPLLHAMLSVLKLNIACNKGCKNAQGIRTMLTNYHNRTLLSCYHSRLRKFGAVEVILKMKYIMSRSIPRNCNLTAITPTEFFVFETNDIHQRLHALKQFYCPNLLVQTANSFTTCQICSFLRNLTVLQINRNSGTLRDYTTRDAVVFSGAKGVRQEALTDSRRRNDRFKRGVNQLGPYVGQWFSTGAAQLNVKLKNSY